MNNAAPYQYKYDKIGNLVQNTTDGIADIEWNIYGKVEKVTKTPDPFGIQATVEYRYDGTGNRIMKKVTKGITVHTNYYLRDASGNVMAIYEKKTDQNVAIKEIPIYGSSRLGQYRPKAATKKTALGQRIYEFSNHLGNVLVTLTDNKVPQTDGTYSSVVVSASDYYPFGMAMSERTYSNSEYRYGFNGKEKDWDIAVGKTDFGARIYDELTGRWFSVDALAYLHPDITPYRAFFNDPINFIDKDGNIEWPLKGTYIIQKNPSKYIKEQKVYVKRGGAWIKQTGDFESGVATEEFKSYLKKPDYNAIIRTSQYNILRLSTVENPKTSPHVGTDLRASEGTPLYSLGTGKVTNISRSSGNLTIKYGNGDKVTFRHLKSIDNDLKIGSTVFEGEIVGQTGKKKTLHSHLHIEAVNENGISVNFEDRTYGTITNEQFFNEYNGDHTKLPEYIKLQNTIIDILTPRPITSKPINPNKQEFENTIKSQIVVE